MKSLFYAPHNQELIDRINSLSPSSQAKWGKMNVSQMFTHCQAPLNLAFGNVKAKESLMGKLFGSVIKKIIVDSDKPFKQNLPTDRSFVIVDTREFEKEKNALIALIQQFLIMGPEGFSKERHPIFGKLTNKDWDKLTWKHLDHHLRQFGA